MTQFRKDGDDRGTRGDRGDKGRGPQPASPPGRPFRTFAFWALVVLLALAAYRMYAGGLSGPQRAVIDYNDYVQQVERGNIEKVTFAEETRTATGELKTETSMKVGDRATPVKAFKTTFLGDGAEWPERVRATNPQAQVSVQSPGLNWLNILFTWFPLVLFLVAWMFVMRQMQGGGSAAMRFGKSKARVLVESNPKITFKDVAGCDEAKQELQEVIEFLKEPQKFQRLGGRIPKGALLLGPPGSGKTLLAKAVAGEAGVPFFSMSGSDFVEMFVGVGASVTGDTPVLIRREGRTQLTSIGDFVDGFYPADKHGYPVLVDGLETLGFEEKDSKFRGSSKTFLHGSSWKGAKAVYRHKVDEIFEIHYLGGVLRTTGDHSVFIRTRDGVKAVETRDLKAGDHLVQLPDLPPGLAEEIENSTRPHDHHGGEGGIAQMAGVEIAERVDARKWLPGSTQSDPVVREVIRKPYDGYVYDLCGCENEAFFGGEKPLLLHNSRVRDLFEQGKRNAPCIIFIDEIDAVGRHRGAGLGGGHDEREQTLNQLLVEMDGFESNEGVIIIAATNRPDVLDPALLRPGRFDRQVVVDWPDVRGREGILKVHSRKIPLAEDVDLKLLARETPGMSGADLANIVNEAALLAARRNHKKVSLRDFEDAKDKVTLGLERRSLVMSEKERKTTAYHEAGHALVAWLIPGSDPVTKITIIPRGRALGVTAYAPAEERHNHSKQQLEERLAHAMGGRAAEIVVFDHLTTGAASDLEQSTNIARSMVTRFGMSDKLGPLTFGKREDMVFLGKEITSSKDYSESTAQLIDTEVRGIVERAHARAVQLLKDNLDKLHLLANTLLERETIDGDEMDRVLRGEKLEPRQRYDQDGSSPTASAPVAKPSEAGGQLAFPDPNPSPNPA